MRKLKTVKYGHQHYSNFALDERKRGKVERTNLETSVYMSKKLSSLRIALMRFYEKQNKIKNEN